MKIIQPEAHILPQSDNILRHVERCGRIAYKSENAITEDSYINFIARMIGSGHESVLEHGNYVFELPDAAYEYTVDLYNSYDFNGCAKDGMSGRLRFSSKITNVVSGNIRAWRDFIRIMDKEEIPAWMYCAFSCNPAFTDLGIEYRFGEYKLLQREDLSPEEQLIHWTETVHFVCSRAISHELVRHRALSPTQESQRYCNYSKGRFGGEVTFIQPLWYPDIVYSSVALRKALAEAEKAYFELLELGRQPQEAREVLPNSTKTELVMTGTLGEWKHFFDLRCAEDAHPEARRIAIPLREEFGW